MEFSITNKSTMTDKSLRLKLHLVVNQIKKSAHQFLNSRVSKRSGASQYGAVSLQILALESAGGCGYFGASHCTSLWTVARPKAGHQCRKLPEKQFLSDFAEVLAGHVVKDEVDGEIQQIEKVKDVLQSGIERSPQIVTVHGSRDLHFATDQVAGHVQNHEAAGHDQQHPRHAVISASRFRIRVVTAQTALRTCNEQPSIQSKHTRQE